MMERSRRGRLRPSARAWLCLTSGEGVTVAVVAGLVCQSFRSDFEWCTLQMAMWCWGVVVMIR